MITGGRGNVVDLTRRQQQTKAQLLEHVFQKHVAGLRNFIRGHMVPEEDLEDVVQDVFARLMSFGDLEAKLSANSGSNRAFILSIANNLIVDQVRRKRVRRNYDAKQQMDEAEKAYEISPEASVSASRELEFMKQVIMEMRPTWRNAFVLNRFKHMSYRQVADSMGVSLKQVEHFMAKAIDRIQKAERLLGKDGERS